MAEILKDRVAVVTGAGRGVGRGSAMLMAQEGAKVVVNDLGGTPNGTGASASPAEQVVAEIKSKGGKAVASYDSVASMKGGESIIKTAVDSFGRVDILVNNAGILRDRMIYNMGEEEWDAVIAVHLKGHFACTKFASIMMRQQHYGRIINVGSTSGLGNMGQANYSAAKEGIVGFTRTVARDLGRYGVTCNAIRPRAATRLTVTPELLAAWQKRAAAGGPAIPDVAQLDPNDVAPFVVYLASEAAGNVNGYDFEVGGGIVSLMSQPTRIKTLYKKGRWDVAELIDIMPKTLTDGLVNPAPPEPG